MPPVAFEVVCSLGPLLTVGFVAALVAGSFAGARRLRERRTEALARVAARLGGRADAAGIVGYDQIGIAVDGVPARVESFEGARKSPPFTRFVAPWMSDLRLSVRPKSILWAVQASLGASSVATGNREVDERFRVRATPPSFAIDALGGPAGEVLLAWAGDLRRLDADGCGVTLALRRSLLLRDEDALVRFAGDAAKVWRALRDAAALAGAGAVRA